MPFDATRNVFGTEELCKVVASCLARPISEDQFRARSPPDDVPFGVREDNGMVASLFGEEVQHVLGSRVNHERCLGMLSWHGGLSNRHAKPQPPDAGAFRGSRQL